jgi:hypothetical protein
MRTTCECSLKARSPQLGHALMSGPGSKYSGVASW